MRSRAVLLLLPVLALALPHVIARAQDTAPTEAPDADTVEARLRADVEAADDTHTVAATCALAAFLEEQGRYLEAAGLRRTVRERESSAENATAEARCLLAFAEQVLAQGGSGGGIRAAFEDARLALVRAREAGADDVETAIGLARCAAAQGDQDREIAELERAALRRPDDVRAPRALGFAYLNAGRFDDAVRKLEPLSEAAPDDVTLARAVAYCATQLGDTATAATAARRAIEAAPDAAEGWQSLWSVYASERRYGELADVLVKLADRMPENAAAAHYAGFALAEAKRPAEALVRLARAVELKPENTGARIRAARVHLSDLRDDAKAAALYEDVLGLEPGNPSALEGLQFLAIRLGDEQKHAAAIPYFRAVAEARADDGSAQANLALALRWVGRYDDAVAAYEKAVERAPYDAQIRNDFGLLLLVMKRDDDATRVFREAHDVDPLANDCVENLGFMARERGDLADAEHWFAIAWEAAVRRGDADLIRRHRRNVDDVRFPLDPL